MNKVSCITVTKNRVSHLKKCIQYFINQTHEDKELIIVYYNVDKKTEKYLNDNSVFLTKNNVKYFKFIEDEGLHLGTIRNFAITKSTGKWLCIWDDDDYYSNVRIENQLNECISKDLIGCSLERIMIYNKSKKEIKLSFKRQEGWEGSIFVMKDYMPKYRNIPKGEDTPVLHELIESSNFITLLEPDLYGYIFHENNISGDSHKENILRNSYDVDIRMVSKYKLKLDWL
jgi:glycosyltransferase involved in cell wall biosynthesis